MPGRSAQPASGASGASVQPWHLDLSRVPQWTSQTPSDTRSALHRWTFAYPARQEVCRCYLPARSPGHLHLGNDHSPPRQLPPLPRQCSIEVQVFCLANTMSPLASDIVPFPARAGCHPASRSVLALAPTTTALGGLLHHKLQRRPAVHLLDDLLIFY
jgi:hypothetical protein